MSDVPVIILAGQSNAAMGGIDNRIVERLTSLGGAFEFVKRAVGGTSLFSNSNMDWSPTSTNELFSQLVADILAAAANVRAQGHNPVFTILWVHGEADRNNVGYGEALRAFIAALRDAISTPDLEFYISALPYASAARDGQAAVDAADGRVHLIQTTGAGFWDGIHYDHATRDRIANDFVDRAAPSTPSISGYRNLLAGQTGVQNGPHWEVRLPDFLDADFTSDDRHHRVFSASGDDNITTGAGFDQIWTGDNDDTVRSGGGNDYIDLGDHEDRAWAGAGDDSVRGGNGVDVIYGEEGNDTLYGDAQSDTLFGGDGDDRLTGGSGNDYIDGGEGYDIAAVTGARSAYQLFSKPGGFVLRGPDGVDWLTNVELIRFGDGSVFDLMRACGDHDGWISLDDYGPLILPGVTDAPRNDESADSPRDRPMLELRIHFEEHEFSHDLLVDHMDHWLL